ncbi:MAG TPA: hypothetical protein VMV18_03730 [bacterium]|nr:hypothetical protein [bacterium]
MNARALTGLVTALLLVAISPAAHARVVRQDTPLNFANGTFGAGLQLGCPTGFVIKARLSPANSFQAAAGFGCGEDLLVTGDYVLEMANFFSEPNQFQLSWYLGIGGRYAVEYHAYHNDTATNVDLGPRVPIGMEFHFSELKWLEAYLEIAPGIDFVDDPGVTVDAGVGARIFF